MGAETMYKIIAGSVGPKGPMPDRIWWDRTARHLRREGMVREAGVLVGHIVSAQGVVIEPMLRLAEKNYADAVEPPFSESELAQFDEGFVEVINVNAVLERVK